MKKLLGILIILSIFVLPNVSASSYRFNYYCDSKQALDDGTFYMTCHLQMTSDMEINHVKGTLQLKNVTLQSIKTNSDWTSQNNLSSNVEFNASTSHTGTFSIADFVFTGNSSDKECEASFVAELAEKVVTTSTEPETPATPVVEKPSEEETNICKVVDNLYYGKDGNTVSEETYFEECFNYTCTVVDNKYYFNNQGKSVSYDEMMSDCSTVVPESPSTGIDYGYILLPLGLGAIFAITRFVKKNQKIFKI